MPESSALAYMMARKRTLDGVVAPRRPTVTMIEYELSASCMYIDLEPLTP